MIGDAYATAANYRAVITKTDTGEDTEVLDHLTAVSRVMERHLGRHFTQDASVLARFYYVGGPECALGQSLARFTPSDFYFGGLVSRELWVPDIATATGLIVKRDENLDGSFAADTAWTVDVDFELHPLNAASEPEAQPFTKLVIPAWSTKDIWREGQHIQITSKKGWPAVPKAIERACIDLTAILRLESPRATKRIPESASSDILASDEAMAIVSRLMSTYGRGAATVFS